MAVWLYAACVVALLAYFLLDIPVQLSDSLQNILAVHRRTMRELFIHNLWSAGYLRPLLFAPIKAVYELSNGHYTVWFRGVHVAQVALTVALFVPLLRVRTWSDAAVAPLALAALVAMHTFAGTIREAYPVNGYLTIVDCCLGAAVIGAGRPRWWSTPVALALLALATLTAESGLLVWVVVMAGFIAGWRGVPRWGVALLTLAVAGYFVARFTVFHVGAPGFSERSTGFGLSILDPEQIIARFGANPLPLYAYNVLASMGSVLFAEPRAGVFWIAKGALEGHLQPWTIVNLVACTSLTLAIAWYVVCRRAAWFRWRLDHGDQLVFVGAGMLVANATMNYVYTKDAIMSPAGAFYALAGYAAIRAVVVRLPAMMPSLRLTASVCLLLCATAWGIKTMGVHYNLRHSARDTRWNWAFVDEWLVNQEVPLTDPKERAIKEALQADALWRRPALPRIEIHWPWPGEWFDTSQ